MKHYLILAQSPALAANLTPWLLKHDIATEDHVAVYHVGERPTWRSLSDEFRRLADWLEGELAANTDARSEGGSVVITDLGGYAEIRAKDLNPVASTDAPTDLKPVLGMLILAFPDVHWVFAAGRILNSCAKWAELHHAPTPDALKWLLQERAWDYSPLFDAGGLRDAIRTDMMVFGGDTIDAIRVPVRREQAVAIDEECSYANLHAYSAYRFGYRSCAITTLKGMRQFLRAEKPHLVIEDLFLHFSEDKPLNFSCLRERDKVADGFPALAEARFRILVTSGHHHGQATGARIDNPIYLRELRANGQWNRSVQKPLAGIFSFWASAQLNRRLRSGGRRGLAPGFDWPMVQTHNDLDQGGHGAPGRLLLIADRLITRADNLRSRVSSVFQAVQGAAIATDALELLGGKTPTTALEALALKHQFEVLAECQFVGMQEHMDVKSRFKDLKIETGSLCHWFGGTKRERRSARWNAELAILDKLIKIFNDFNQYDEEQFTLARARMLHRKLWFHKRPWLKPLEWAPWYVEKLLASVPLFLIAIVAWIAVLGFIFGWIGSGDLGRGYVNALTTFFSVQPPADDQFWGWSDGFNGRFSLIAATIILGFVHVGIFISHLYSIIARK